MKEEIARILTMVQEDKISADQAAELIQALQHQNDHSNAISTHSNQSQGSSYWDKMLRIRVSSEDGDKVNVNLPIRLIKVGLKAGLNIAAKIPESAKYVQDIDVIDIDLILESIEQELSGQIVNVESADGEKVSVTIE